MKKYFISLILFTFSTASFADFDMRTINKDPKIQAAKEKCFSSSPKDHRGVVYKTPFRQCMIDSGIMVGNYKNKTNRSQVKFKNNNNNNNNPAVKVDASKTNFQKED